MKTIVCLDLEGVLVPEIWIAVARKTKIQELFRTTREEPNYDRLMKYRMEILRRHRIRLKDIQAVICTLRPLPGAKSFLSNLRKKTEVVILSDTFYEFAGPLMAQLDFPTLFCNWLEVDAKGYLTKHHMRQNDGKRKAVQALRKIGFSVHAAGDSYNDIGMLQTAHKGILFRPPAKVVQEFPQFPVVQTYAELMRYF